MSVESAQLAMQFRVTEKLDDVPSASSPFVVHDAYKYAARLDDASTPPATEVCYEEFTLAAGAKTIDLTALPATEGTLNGTGKKVQAIMFHNLAANNPMTFKVGASNGYRLGDDSSWQHILKADQRAMFSGEGGNPDISATAKNIDVSGTGAEKFHVAILLG